jgi:hypothetical protein
MSACQGALAAAIYVPNSRQTAIDIPSYCDKITRYIITRQDQLCSLNKCEPPAPL